MAAAHNANVDVYDEEFFSNLKIAKNLTAQIFNKHDKEICKKWIRKLCDLKSSDPVVKKNRNSFFKYMLQILHKGIEGDSDMPHLDDRGQQTEQFMSRWSADRKTYIAAQPIPGQGTMVYLAVAKDPDLGWEHP